MTPDTDNPNEVRYISSMKLKSIKKNLTELTLSDGTVVLFSYETPVAIERKGECFRTSEQYSSTTTRHLNRWLDGRHAGEVDQGMIDQLVVAK